MSNKPVAGSSDKTAFYEAYMSRVGAEKIPVYEPTLGGQEIEFLTDVIRRNWLSEGKYVREFESRLSQLSQRRHALAFCNATAAFISGMKSLGIGPGDEVIVPSFAHSADPNSIANTGATPVFADVDEQTLCLSVETIDAVRTSRTRAILHINAYGNAADLDSIASYAKQHGLAFINDCAPALYGTYRNRSIASYGDFAVLSFFADKTITTGEGGMLLTDNPDLVSEANIYKHDGRRERGYDLIERIGFNFRLTELQAAVGVAQLNRLEFFVARKLEILGAYQGLLSGIPEVTVFRFNPEGRIVPHRVIIMVPEAKPLIDRLNTGGIGVRTLFMPMHSMPVYNSAQRFPATERLYARGVCLPSAPTLTHANIEYICDTIRDYYQRGHK